MKPSFKKEILSISARYFILLLVAIPNLWIFYKVFTPLTIYPVYSILNLFFETAILSNEMILVNDFTIISLIPACIAGSAYFLLLILNLSTPKINLKTRIYGILFAFGVFLVLNIIRIVILSCLFVTNSIYFDISHRIFWHSLSTIFVVGIWFAEMKVFKIKEIPVYSDLKFLFKKSKLF